MEELIDLIATDSTPSEISDAIKDILYAKAADKINDLRPYVGTSMFDDEGNEETFEDQE